MDKIIKNETLTNVYKTCTMGVHAIDTIMPDILNVKLRDLVSKQNDIYKSYMTRCQNLASNLNIDIDDIGAMAKINSYIGIKGSMMMDNSKTNIASKLIQGTVMGITTVLSGLHNTKNINKDIVNICQDIVNDMEKFVESLKEFV